MAKVFIFTLNFVSSINQTLHESYASQPSPYPSLSGLTSSVDSSGLSQYFSAFGLHNLVRYDANDSGIPEALEIHCFTRAFTQLFQVHRAAREGCADIRRFYNLVSEMKSKEQVYVLCRIVIHGGQNADDGFFMEVLQPSGCAQAAVAPYLLSQILVKSMTPEMSHRFTPQTPLNIFLISCSAANADQYKNLASNSLAGKLVQYLQSKNLFVRIKASTTTLLTINSDYRYFRLIAMIDMQRFFNEKTLENELELLFGEYYCRRGAENAITHIQNHFNTPEIKDSVQLFNKKKLRILNISTYLPMSDVLRLRKIGYTLTFTPICKDRIHITDSISQLQFHQTRDLTLEWHRDILLQYLWLGIFYRHFSETNKIFLSYCLPIPNTELAALVDRIECAYDRTAIGAVLTEFITQIMQSGELSQLQPKFSKDVLRWICSRYEIFGLCRIQSINFQDLVTKFKENSLNMPAFVA